MTSITTNIAAQLAANNLKKTFKGINDSAQRLTSGNSIVSASDDAAGLAIGTGLSIDVKTLTTALKNTSQAISLLNVADGALAQIGEILSRQKELAVTANSGTLSSVELGYLNTEFQALKSQIDDIANQTNFNGIKLIDGSASGTSNAQSNTTGVITYTDVGTAGTTALSNTAVAATLFVFDTTNGNDLSLQGSLSGLEITITRSSATDVAFEVLINGVLYSELNVNVNASAGTDLILTLVNAASGAEINIVLDGTNAVDVIDLGNQASATAVEALLEADLSTIRVYQSRSFVDGTTGAVFNTDAIVGTAIDGLIGNDLDLRSDRFSGTLAPTIGAFSVTAETASTDGQISVQIGGQTFETAAGVFNSISADITTTITLTNVDDDNEILVIDFNSATAATIAINSTAAAQAIEDGLNAGFGVGSQGSLDFQVGLESTDLISVIVASALTTDIYKDSDGVAQTLDLTTTANANTASAVLDEAINDVLSARAGVGASQSRFGFAAANLDSTITNLDASRGTFLDTNITTEATKFAKNQVLQQAGISILAQANLLPQNLLKLLG